MPTNLQAPTTRSQREIGTDYVTQSLRLQAKFQRNFSGKCMQKGRCEPACHRSFPADADRPIAALWPAEDLQGSTMERVKRVEDLNICIIGAQGIVGVGVCIRTFTVPFPWEARRQTIAGGYIPSTLSSYP